MKKLFKKFTWKKFFLFAVAFSLTSVPISWFFGEFKEPNFTWNKYLIGLLVKVVVFSLFMSLIIDDKKMKDC